MAGAIFTVAEPVATLISLDPVVLITIFPPAPFVAELVKRT